MADRMSMEQEIAARSLSTGLPVSVLKAVYLRETQTSLRGGAALCASALHRVDGFICYAMTRDTNFSQDRDLVPSIIEPRI